MVSLALEQPTLAYLNVTDGEPQQKKRGPKPDATPALTKKQELNRLAQR